jgi:integrase
MDTNKSNADLQALLRAELELSLQDDLKRRLERLPGRPLYAHWWELGDEQTAQEAELSAIRNAKSSLARDLQHNTLVEMEDYAEKLVHKHGLPPEVTKELAVGLIEVAIRAWEVIERRTLGLEPVVFAQPDVQMDSTKQSTQASAALGSTAGVSSTPDVPLASSLTEPYFVHRRHVDGSINQVINQDRTTIRHFLQVCGDRPVDRYNRGDISKFLETLRRLPSKYGRSPADKGKSIMELIADADASDAPRVAEKTVKRHLAALTQFFQYAVDQGHVKATDHADWLSKHRFKGAGPAKLQRGTWTSDELKRLFSSPIWRGCDPHFRTQTGPEVIRDSKFWIPLLGLYEGARLEELADLYRRDIEKEDDVWCIRITATETRRLKTKNSQRVIPLHSALIRMGFLQYVIEKAPKPDDPLFPDLAPQGVDKKRGPRFTRFFGHYRKTIGIYREGIAMHSFRHLVSTRLRNKVNDYEHARHINCITGHSQQGSEGDVRYDKGPGVKAIAQTLELLEYPELDLSHLYIASTGNQTDGP